MLRIIVSTALATASLAVVGASSAPAAATPCDQGAGTAMWKRPTRVVQTYRPHAVSSNPSSASRRVSTSFDRDITRGPSIRWEDGASGGFDVARVRADISARYGELAVEPARTGSGGAVTQTVLPGHTAWVEAVLYRKVTVWRAYTSRWSTARKACVRHTLAKAYWGTPRFQYDVMQAEGRRPERGPVGTAG